MEVPRTPYLLKLHCFVLLIATTLVSGCVGPGYKQFYQQVAPTTYPQTKRVLVFKYSEDLDDIYKHLYSDWLIIGRSDFVGPYENPDMAKGRGMSLGADIIIASANYAESRTGSMTLTTPTVTTSQVSGYTPNGYVSGTVTTYGTQSKQVPITVERYNQSLFFLKNVNNQKPIWEKTKTDFLLSSDHVIAGRWKNKDYEIEVFQSDADIVGFLISTPKKEPAWKQGELKFIFNSSSGNGIFLRKSKAPSTGKFGVNKFGHLEVKHQESEAPISFMRVSE